MLVMVLVIAGAYLTSRYLAKKSSQMTQGKYLKVVDRIFLGRDKSIFIVQIGEKVYLMSESDSGASLIAVLSEADLIPLAAQTGFAFRDIMQKYLGRQPEEGGNEAYSSALDELKKKVRGSLEQISRKNSGEKKDDEE